MCWNQYKRAIAARLRARLIGIGYHAKPRFLIIGAQKAGTTALFYYLAEHPQLIPATEKEIEFFTPELFQGWPEHPFHHVLCSVTGTHFGDPGRHRKAGTWYHSHFPLPHQLGRERMTYEATPEYLYYPKAAERIWKYDPKIMLIVLLRDPVERAFSAWNMYRGFGDGYRPLVYAPHRETRGFDEAIRDEIQAIQSGRATFEPGYVRRGLYHEQLLRYFKLFRHEQLLILDSRALKDDTAGIINQISHFLGLAAYQHDGAWAPLHVGHYEAHLADATAHLLREFYRPHNEKLYQLLQHDFGWPS